MFSLHELNSSSIMSSSRLETGADELPPTDNHPGETRAAHAAPIVHPGQICADGQSSRLVYSSNFERKCT